jgi:hypothetical protein
MLLSRLLALVAAARTRPRPRRAYASRTRPTDCRPTYVRCSCRSQRPDAPAGQVTWDQYSLMINGERMHIFPGELYPYRSVAARAPLRCCVRAADAARPDARVPSPPRHSLEEIKALGFNAVFSYRDRLLRLPQCRLVHRGRAGGRHLPHRAPPAVHVRHAFRGHCRADSNAETTASGISGWGTCMPSELGVRISS